MSTEVVSKIYGGNVHRKVTSASYDENIKPVYDAMKKFDLSATEFDPKIHLAFTDDCLTSTRRLTMEELGLSNKKQISDVGVSDPFPLFTDEAVAIMRQEIFTKETFEKYGRFSNSSTSGKDCVLRGYAKESCPFTYSAWTHPATLAAVSKMAGVELQVIMDYEVAHVNVGMKSKEEAEQERITSARDKALSGVSSGEDIPAITGWHYDSYPFVCVLMLSDTTEMIGGETSLRMGNRKIATVPGPKQGSAAVLQGRYIQHIAPKPLGASERITMVTSYIAKNPMTYEGSVLKTVKPEISSGSRYDDFYPQWIDYRSNILKARIDDLQKTATTSTHFDKESAVSKLKDLEAYIKHTYTEMEVTEEEYRRAAKFA